MVNNNIFDNTAFLCAMSAVIIAQVLKPFFNYFFHEKFNADSMLSTGGMPSSHTAGVVALTTSIIMLKGLASFEFAIAAVFAMITMHDAMNIRNEAGKQAKVINEWSKILSNMHKDGPFTQENLKTMLGHSFAQVLCGIILGVAVGVSGTLLLT